jgi:hypothetical protein
MLAWRDNLVAQLQHFNESAQSAMPNLGNLNGPLAALQDYQAYPMVRRVSSLFPHRPSTRQQASSREGWWETLTGTSIPTPSLPPAYGDLFPEEDESSQDWALKKSSTVQAAADAAADLHFDAQSSSRPYGPSSSTRSVVKKPIERIGLRRDRKLWCVWVSGNS